MQKTACQEWPRKLSCLFPLWSSRFALKGAWDWTNTYTLGPLNGEGARKGCRPQFPNESWYHCLSGCRVNRSSQKSSNPIFRMVRMHLAFHWLYKEHKQLWDAIMDSRCSMTNKMGNRTAEEEHVWISQELRVIRSTAYFTTEGSPWAPVLWSLYLGWGLFMDTAWMWRNTLSLLDFKREATTDTMELR